MKIKIAIRFLGVGLFVVLCIKSDLKTCFSILIGANFLFFFFSIIIGFFIIGVRVLRWQQILFAYNISIKFVFGYILSLVSNSYASITPGRLGEIVKPLFLKKRGYSFSLAFKSILIDRICDFITLLVFGFISIIYFMSKQQRTIDITKYIVLLLIAILLMVVIIRYFASIRNRIVKILPSKWFQLYNDGEGTPCSLSQLLSRNKLILSLTSLSAFILTCIKYLVLAAAIKVYCPFIYFIFIMSLLMLSRVIPISFLNLGTREAILISLLGSRGICQEDALAFSFLILADMLIFIILGQLIGLKYFPSIGNEESNHVGPVT